MFSSLTIMSDASFQVVSLKSFVLKHLVIQRDPSTSDFGVLQGGGKDAESPLNDFFQRNARPLQEIGDPRRENSAPLPSSKVMANPFKLIPRSLAFCGFPSSTLFHSMPRPLTYECLLKCRESYFTAFQRGCRLQCVILPLPAHLCLHPMGHTFSVHMFSESVVA